MLPARPFRHRRATSFSAPLVLSFALVFVGATASPAFSQAPATQKKAVTSDSDLPRFSYPVDGTASALVNADDATFNLFANKVGADVDSMLANYSIEDKATMRSLLGAKMSVQMLTGHPKEAEATQALILNLQEKPQAKAMSGLIGNAIFAAWIETGSHSGAAYDAAFAKHFQAEVNALPWEVAQDGVKSMNGMFGVVTPELAMAQLKSNIDPEVAKSKSVDYPAAVSLLNVRLMLEFILPVKQQIVAALTPYIAAHNVEKPDIWAARDVTFTASDKLTPVRIAVWDGGVDTSIFPSQVFNDTSPSTPGHEHGPHGLAFDVKGNSYSADLQPVTPQQKDFYPKALALEQGLNDLQSSISSPAADNVRKFASSTPPDQMASNMRDLNFFGQWMHGTHVAGIAARGNPAARLVVVAFYDSLPEIPFAPTVEWANKFKADFLRVGEYFRDNNVRVVNMSWADSQGEIEEWLSKTSPEKDVTARKQFAAQIYGIWREAVAGAIQAAPNTLFICAAGNSDSNAGFLGDVPASLKFPNLIAVGAVDQAGEETSFTSYGDTVVLDADGFQVESYVPGGTRLKMSGTSMASPNVVNLAGKLIALDPSLTPEQTIALMEKGADASANGRLHVINPKASVALLQQKSGKTGAGG
jgi:subtilisin family serine protease